MTKSTKLVILKLENGDFERGFSVTLQIYENSQSTSVQQVPPFLEVVGKLPPASRLSKTFEIWQDAHHALGARHLGADLEIEETEYYVSKINRSAQDLSHHLNIWMNSLEFRPITEKLNEILNFSEKVRVLVQANEPEVWQLPWHLWTIFQNNPHTEIGLSFPGAKKIKRRIASEPRNQVRILAIFGDSTGIDIEQDRKALEQSLSTQAEIVFLNEPQRKELYEKLWDKQGWDILFFAGHSDTDWYIKREGRVRINRQDYITTSQLKYALRTAIALGLKLAIFNSCDGLGLAKSLADLQIPQVIVMRKPVPDKLAQVFVQDFLQRFTQGNFLYAAIQEAQQRLQVQEDKYPCASWLPVVCQNPADEPINWQKLSNPQELLNTLAPENDWEVCCRYHKQTGHEQ